MHKLLVLLLTSLVGVSLAAGPRSAGPPEFTADRTLDQALSLAGDNRAELEKAIASAPKEHKAGLSYLIRYMPKRDLTSLEADFLVQNSAVAHQARNAHDWAKAVPEEIFYNDVLPYVCLNETREDWRTDFHKRFAPKVKDAKTLREAVILVNKAIRDEVQVDYNTKRKRPDQSPAESMEIKMASCTGLSILLADALRAVGIPARVAGTPAWTTKRGNHNWVEFYDPETKKWHFTEYYPDKKGIDHGWLLADAAQANAKSFYHAVYANSWKPTGRNFPLVWNLDINYVPAVNVTARYVELAGPVAADKTKCELRIDYTAAGKRFATEVQVAQADAMIGSGTTPGPTRDMNEFLTIPVKRGQIYQILWKNSEGKLQRTSVKPEKDQAFHRIELGQPTPPKG